MEITLTLTPKEADELAKLIDSAIKAEGIPAAKVGVPLFEKIKAAYDKVNPLPNVPA
jgi:hypothetical protein